MNPAENIQSVLLSDSENAVTTVKSLLFCLTNLPENGVTSYLQDVQAQTSDTLLSTLLRNVIHVLGKWFPGARAEEGPQQQLMRSMMSHFAADLVCAIANGASIPLLPGCHCSLPNQVSNPLSSDSSDAHTTVTQISDCESLCMKEEEYCDQEYETSSPSSKHCIRVTKEVPAAVIYSAIGVRCMFCYNVFKGTRCVDALMQHTKKDHPSRASPRFLRQLVRDNAPEKIIGNGIPYCTCPVCRVCSYAAADTSL